MNNIEILANALDYMESNLSKNIRTQDVANACYCSKSALEKLFRYATHFSIHDYVIRRKMMLAAKIIAEQPSVNLLDIALYCGYSTNESFSRAFKSVWGMNPSEYKSSRGFCELFPRFLPPDKNGGLIMQKKVDISELYDLFRQRKNCYFICCDIEKLIPINEISRKAGDLAILETMKRMQTEAGAEDIVFRIGGDEFVILTDSENADYAEGICQRLLSYNGEAFLFEQKRIPLKLHVSCCKFEGSNLRYNDLYQQLQRSIEEHKSLSL